MKIYKLVRREFGFLLSYSLDFNQRFSVKYELNKVIKPKIGLLFVFKKLKDARRFRSGRKDGVICLGEADSLKKIDHVVSLVIDPEIKKFWTKSHRVGVMPPPEGTYGCKSLKLIKELD